MAESRSLSEGLAEMEHTPVKSSNVQSVGYDEANRVLEVQYKGGGKPYRYSDVSPEKHKALMGAESIGSHLHQHIKPHHECARCE